MSILERLRANSSYQPGPLETPCLVWNGHRSRTGYGIMACGRRGPRRVHRISWIEQRGPIPAETPCVLHRCDNPPCWEIGHLWLGTQADNMADMVAKGRLVAHNAAKTHCPAGHPYVAENLVRGTGPRHRRCKTCAREGERRRSAARRGVVV